MFTHDELFERVIPYRLSAVDTLNLALGLQLSWVEPQSMEIYLSGRLYIEGNSNAFTNPVVEAGVIHCRALLEFLGLRVSRNNPSKLASRSQKRPDDFGIEDFSNAAGPLPLVSPQEAVRPYKGTAAEAEAALASVLQTANKGVAHFTAGLILSPEQAHHIEIASRGVPTLVVNYLYTRLQMPAPNYKLTSRRRGDC